jgi:hypothetical protein
LAYTALNTGVVPQKMVGNCTGKNVVNVERKRKNNVAILSAHLNLNYQVENEKT